MLKALSILDLVLLEHLLEPLEHLLKPQHAVSYIIPLVLDFG